MAMSTEPTTAVVADESLLSSPIIYKTPLKGTIGSRKTPPSGLTKFIARNPFDAELTSRLHLSVISPTIFSKVSPASHDSPFAWTIEELANMKPVAIDNFPIQQAYCSDPEIESQAQEAIKKFFTQNQIHPSPWDEKREPPKPLFIMTPTRGGSIGGTKGESLKTTRDNSAQTILSFPVDLPQHVEEALKPYLTFTQDQQVDIDDANSSNNSLRRKLFCNNDEFSDEEEECSYILSPIKGSPPQSGMFIHGTPVTRGKLEMQSRTYGTPCIKSGNLTSPNMSPVCNPTNNMSYQSIKSRYRSGNGTRLNFSADMSVDTSLVDDDKSESLNIENIDKNKPSDMTTSLMEDIPRDNLMKNNRNIEGDEIKCNIQEHEIKWKNAHDTGYQTYSMNNTTTANADNRIITPTKNFHWKECIDGMSNNHKEITISDWQKNIETMFSSTPSKRN